jgi:hypothetical protein
MASAHGRWVVAQRMGACMASAWQTSHGRTVRMEGGWASSAWRWAHGRRRARAHGSNQSGLQPLHGCPGQTRRPLRPCHCVPASWILTCHRDGVVAPSRRAPPICVASLSLIGSTPRASLPLRKEAVDTERANDGMYGSHRSLHAKIKSCRASEMKMKEVRLNVS